MITYLKGDATAPSGDGPKIIAHVNNVQGGWGAGFVLAVSKRWPGPEAAYRAWYKSGSIAARKDCPAKPFMLGEIQLVGPVAPDLYVCNMLAQSGYGLNNTNPSKSCEPDGLPPIRYVALEMCLAKVAAEARRLESSVHMPRIGCGLAGGTWGMVGPIVEKALADIPVFVYDLA